MSSLSRPSVAAPQITQPADAALERQVARLVYLEAKLADQHRFDDWLNLWTQGSLHYWIPCNDDDADPDETISIISDDRHGLEERIARLKTRAAYSQRPRSRLSRLVGNLTVNTAEDSIFAEGAFILAEARGDSQDIFAGRVFYHFRQEDDDLKIVAKKVCLANNDGFIDNLSFLP